MCGSVWARAGARTGVSAVEAVEKAGAVDSFRTYWTEIFLR